jgi:hypothetical protein
VDSGKAITVGGFGTVGIEFDGGEMSVGIPRDLKQCSAVTGARINCRVWRGAH